jgi:hypothetical protein
MCGRHTCTVTYPAHKHFQLCTAYSFWERINLQANCFVEMGLDKHLPSYECVLCADDSWRFELRTVSEYSTVSLIQFWLNFITVVWTRCRQNLPITCLNFWKFSPRLETRTLAVYTPPNEGDGIWVENVACQHSSFSNFGYKQINTLYLITNKWKRKVTTAVSQSMEQPVDPLTGLLLPSVFC